MNIAIFTDTYPPIINGVSTSTALLVEMFRKNGHRVIVVAPRFDKGHTEIKDDVIRIPGIIVKKWYGLCFARIYSRKGMRYLKEAKIDLVHYHSDASMGFFARHVVRKFKVPVVYTYHTMYEDYTYYLSKGNKVLDTIFKKVLREYSRISTKHISTIITPSEKGKEYLLNAKIKQPITVIPTGIDVNVRKLTKRENDYLDKFKKENHYTDKTKTVLLLSRIGKEKSVELSIRCVATYINKYHEDIFLLVVGDGPDKEEYMKLASDLGIRNAFIGKVPHQEVNKFYHFADLFLTSSTTETQGLTLIESMAARTIVMARHDEPTDKLIIDKKNGFFFENEEDFTETFHHILNLSPEEKEAISEEMKKTLEPYSSTHFYEQILEVYQNAISKRKENN